MPISIFGGVNLLAEFNLMENPELEKSIAHITVEIIEYVPNAVVIKTIREKLTGHIKGIEHRQYLQSARGLRAAAFAARVDSLKYYIGLIGAPAII